MSNLHEVHLMNFRQLKTFVVIAETGGFRPRQSRLNTIDANQPVITAIMAAASP